MSAKRAREHLSLFASLFAVVLIVAGLGAGLVGFLDVSGTQGVRAELANNVGSDAALRVTQPYEPDDPERQDRAVRGVIAGQLGDLEYDVFRTVASSTTFQVTTDGTPVDPDADPERVAVWSLPELDGLATLTDGRWASGADEATLQADAAEGLGLAVGDTLRLGDTADVTITGLWTADQAFDPRWLSDPLVLDGYSVPREYFGPLVIDESVWPQLGAGTLGRWAIIPDREAITARQLATVQHGWAELLPAAREAGMRPGSMSQEGRFALTVDRLLVRVNALDAVKPVVLLILAAIALVTLLELARLLSEVRATETELLWARGATAGELARATAVEIAVVATAGAVVGAVSAAAALFAVAGADGLAAGAVALWAVPLATAVACVIVFTAQAFRSARLSTRRDAPDRTGRRGQLAAVGAVVLVCIAAGVSVWQLQLYGSPVTPVAGGGTQVDPVTVAAPGLLLVALVLVGLLVFPLAAAVAERFAGRRRSAATVLATRSIARRRSLVATPLVIVALAVGQLVIAAGFSASWQSSFTSSQELRAGSATRADSGYAPMSDSEFDTIAATPGVTSIAPVAIGEVKVAGEYISVVGLAPRALTELSTTAGGVIDPAALADTIDRHVELIQLPGGSAPLTLTAEVSGFAAPETVTVRIRDGYGLGRVVSLELDPDSVTTEDGTTTAGYAGTVPDAVGADGAWGLESIEFDPRIARGPAFGPPVEPKPATPVFELTEVARGDESVDLGEAWSGWLVDDRGRRSVTTTSGHGMELAPTRTARMIAPGADSALGSAIPVVVSAGFAETISAEAGDVVPLALIDGAAPLGTVVAGIAAGVPSAPSAQAILVDRAVLDALRLQNVSDLEGDSLHWLGGDSLTITEELRSALPGNVAVDAVALDPDRPMLGSAGLALWIAAAGCTVLALAALGAVIRAQLRSRRGEATVLRAIGFASGTQGAIRRRELWIVTAAATVVGLVAGAVTVAVTVAALARAAVPAPYRSIPTVPLFEPVLLPVALAALLALIAVAIAVYGREVARQARVALGDEEVR